jgi:hypothetical protein
MPSEEEISACREWLESVVAVDCRAGVYDEANILEALQEIIETELGEPTPALLEDLTAQVRTGLAEHAREEATWSGRTTNDLLDSAFADLDARGVVTAQALGSTLQEGAALIDERCADRDEAARGSVFYHRQDLEDAVEGGGLSLAFVAYGPEADAAAIGREIVHVLSHHGLSVTWSGNPKQRIQLAPFAWQKRRATQAPPGATAAPPPPRAAAGSRRVRPLQRTRVGDARPEPGLRALRVQAQVASPGVAYFAHRERSFRTIVSARFAPS